MGLMSKIAKYLNGHIIGEVSARETRLKQFSTDRSFLKIKPDLVVYPRFNEDIQKIMRFSWQLAEKDYIFGVTARGYGGSTDGSSIGKGIVLDISRHLDKIKELDLRSKTVQVQAGANFQKLKLAIASQAMDIPQSPAGERLTVGGAIAMNLPAEKYNYGELVDFIEEIEVVLSNGDIINMGKISRKELSEKIALSSFEGEIYRKIDALIEDNYSLIQKIDKDSSFGYSGIANVKNEDGTFNLIPLFFGSLGTLGVITEARIKTEYITNETNFMVVGFSNRDDARDFNDEIAKFNPDIVELYDGKMFEAAVASGKKYQFYLDRNSQKLATKLVVVVGVTDKTAKKILSKMNKIQKISTKFEGSTVWIPGDDEFSKAEMESIRDVREILRARSGVIKQEIYPIQGVYVPMERFEAFYLGLQKLALQYSIPAPIQGSALTSVFEILAEFDFSKVTDRQKALRFVADLGALLAKVDGEFAYGAGEGRIYGHFVARNVGEEVENIYLQIKDIFDPMHILNPGVKGRPDTKELAKSIQNGK